jgi:hypothetical protein
MALSGTRSGRVVVFPLSREGRPPQWSFSHRLRPVSKAWYAFQLEKILSIDASMQATPNDGRSSRGGRVFLEF